MDQERDENPDRSRPDAPAADGSGRDEDRPEHGADAPKRDATGPDGVRERGERPLDAVDAGPDTEVPRGATSQVKAQIETGASGDKVAYPDPGASPLGTDDEAAGRPPEPERVEMSKAAEHRAEPAADPPRQSAPRAGPDGDPVKDGAPPRVETTGRFKLAVLAGTVAILVIAVIIALS